MLSATCKNTMLDTAFSTVYVSAHSSYSTSGANELSGGSPAYARAAASFGAAAAASKELSNTPVLNIPAAATVRYIGYWTASTAGTFLGMTPNLGAEREFSADASADTVTSQAHGYVNGDRVVFIGDTPPSGLVEATEYFVVSATTDTFQVAATAGGAAINLTSRGGGSCVVSKIVPEVFSSQGTITVQSLSLALTA